MKYEKSPLYKGVRAAVDTMCWLEILASIGGFAAFVAWLMHFFRS